MTESVQLIEITDEALQLSKNLLEASQARDEVRSIQFTESLAESSKCGIANP